MSTPTSSLLDSSVVASKENSGHNFTLSGQIDPEPVQSIVQNSAAPEVADLHIRPTNAPIDPDTLKRLIDIRTTILRGGIYGMLVGSTVGYCFHVGIQRTFIRTGISKRFSDKYPKYKIPYKFPKNSLLPTILFFGAMASFSSASVSGRDSFNTVTDIWSINSKPKSTYQAQANESKQDLYKSQNDAFDRRISSIRESKAIKEELEKWGPPTK